MNIALIFPRTKYPSGDIPLGVAYLASYLRNNINCNIQIIDTTFHSDYSSYLKKNISNGKFDVVGISAMTTMIDAAYLAANIAKDYNPKTKVLLGGPHATMMLEDSLKNKHIDAVVIGEGEKTFLEFVLNIHNLDNVSGIWYKENGSIKKNAQREMVKNLDDLPYPAWDLLEIEKYIHSWFQLDSISPDIRGVSVIASRGCPYKCSFCQPTLNEIFGKKIRKRSAINIVGELKALKYGYGIEGFLFVDDTLAIDKDWVLSICNEIKKENLKIKWICNFRANLTNEDLLREMKSAGLTKVNIGIESGSQRILDEIYRKGINLEDIQRSVKIAKDLGLKVQGYFMIGAPSETEEEIKKTIELACELPLSDATFSITTPLPGTFLYHEKMNIIDPKVFSNLDYYKVSVFDESSVISKKKIALLKKIAFLRFYLGRGRLISTLKLLLNFKNIRKTILKLKRL